MVLAAVPLVLLAKSQPGKPALLLVVMAAVVLLSLVDSKLVLLARAVPPRPSPPAARAARPTPRGRGRLRGTQTAPVEEALPDQPSDVAAGGAVGQGRSGGAGRRGGDPTDRPRAKAAGCAVAPAGVERAVSPLPPAIAEVMNIITAATGTGEGHLSDDELLARYEQIVNEWQTHALRAGLALVNIQARKLYKKYNEKFEPYYKERFGGLSRGRAGQLMRAARAFTNVYNCSHFSVFPTREGQLRELVRLPDPQDQIEVWHRVVDSTLPKKITAKVIATHVHAFLRERAEQTPDEPDPDHDALMQEAREYRTCNESVGPGRDTQGDESADDEAGGAPALHSQASEDEAEGRNSPTVSPAAEDDHSSLDLIELTIRSFQEGDPAARIYGPTADDNDHARESPWTVGRNQLVAAYVFQTSSPDEQRERLTIARANPAYAAEQGIDAVSRFFNVITGGLVLIDRTRDGAC